jgi:hypothetical protein
MRPFHPRDVSVTLYVKQNGGNVHPFLSGVPEFIEQKPLFMSEIQIPGNSEKELWANCGSAVLQSVGVQAISKTHGEDRCP